MEIVVWATECVRERKRERNATNVVLFVKNQNFSFNVSKVSQKENLVHVKRLLSSSETIASVPMLWEIKVKKMIFNERCAIPRDS